jgi:hypothetical protein
MSYEVYRKTTLGNTLQETLDELMQVLNIGIKLGLLMIYVFESLNK